MEVILVLIIQLHGAAPIQREGKMDTLKECVEAVAAITEHYTDHPLPKNGTIATGCRMTFKGDDT